jgi:hypothetical protein
MLQLIVNPKTAVRSRTQHGKTGIMMELHVVKGPVEERLALENDDDDELGHGCKVMLHLLRYWTSAKFCIVCADSYFASVQATCCLFDLNFWFSCVVKTATKLFLKTYLGKVELPIHGTVAALTAVHDGVELLAFVYCDHDRHYFISTCSLTLQVGIQFVIDGCNNCNPLKRTSHQNR